MRKSKARLIDHPELKIVLFFVGYALLSWPIFTEDVSSIGELYLSLFLLWLVAIAMLFFSRDTR
ncbi:hypothetical protein [Neptuniibacter caesariensis]|uniref:Uncharacterized protein n=1 Tax=Neptuniibacter caesariensis TaxID=207954 RepID=A0A7U8C9Q3_NEPCE|nr:hypothetical protein [Neptuniibacter caesariensis]EAR62739.1 hypothetical protein MED92_06458 [Oceanospirillum sp. MED92] [Neptuniibacter caesariensis]